MRALKAFLRAWDSSVGERGDLKCFEQTISCHVVIRAPRKNKAEKWGGESTGVRSDGKNCTYFCTNLVILNRLGQEKPKTQKEASCMNIWGCVILRRRNSKCKGRP